MINEEILKAKKAWIEKNKKYILMNQEKIEAIEYRKIHGVPEKKIKEPLRKAIVKERRNGTCSL